MTKTKRKSTRYAITLARLDEKTGKTLHNLSAGHDDWTKFNKTDLEPFLTAFAENDVKFEDNAAKWAEHDRTDVLVPKTLHAQDPKGNRAARRNQKAKP